MDVLKINSSAAIWDDGGSAVACVVRNSIGKLLLVDGWQCEYKVGVDAEMSSCLGGPPCSGTSLQIKGGVAGR